MKMLVLCLFSLHNVAEREQGLYYHSCQYFYVTFTPYSTRTRAHTHTHTHTHTNCYECTITSTSIPETHTVSYIHGAKGITVFVFHTTIIESSSFKLMFMHDNILHWWSGGGNPIIDRQHLNSRTSSLRGTNWLICPLH